MCLWLDKVFGLVYLLKFVYYVYVVLLKVNYISVLGNLRKVRFEVNMIYVVIFYLEILYFFDCYFNLRIKTLFIWIV